jgi:hypothetical protein
VKGDIITIGLKNEPTMPAGEVKDLTLVIDNVSCETKNECIVDGILEFTMDVLEHSAE